MKTETFTLGVDLGGTNTALAVVDAHGGVLAESSFPTATESFEDWVAKLKSVAFEMIPAGLTFETLKGIGIGAPCSNAETGVIEGATDLPWPSPIPVKMIVERYLELPVIVSNDANAAAIGEMRFGAAQGMRNFIVLTLGTGVGAGIVCDGHLLSGKRGFAGELGHVRFGFASDRDCGCGRKGCLQTVASAKGIMETARRLLAKEDSPSAMRDIPFCELNPQKIALLAKAGDSLAKEVFEFTGRCLGEAAAEFAAFTDPEAIFLFGGVSKAGDLLLRPMREAFAKGALHLYRDNVAIALSGVNESRAAVLGAAALPLWQLVIGN